MANPSANSTSGGKPSLPPYRHTHFESLLKQAGPNLTQGARDMAQLVALHETSYGLSWKPPGDGSFNMGAITGTGPAGFFTYGDSIYDTKQGKVKQYTTKFRKYPTEAAGVSDLITVALRNNVRAQADMGSLAGAAAAMYANHYYTTNLPPGPAAPLQYFQALQKRVPAVEAALGRPLAFNDARTPVTLEDMRLTLNRVTGNTHVQPADATAPINVTAGPTPSGKQQFVLLAVDPAHVPNIIRAAGAVSATPVATNIFDPSSKSWHGWKA